MRITATYSDDRERYVKETMMWNSRNTSLTGDQHRALAILCTYRHKIHTNRDVFYLSSSVQSRKTKGFLLKALPLMLRQAGLPELDFEKELSLIVNDEQEKAYDINRFPSDSYFRFVAEVIVDEINTKIEDYLTKIDLEHGTMYAPTKIARLRNCA